MTQQTLDIAALLNPIAEDPPCGPSVRGEPEFEQVQDEINKLGSLVQAEVDWGVVVNVSSQLLQETSKDLLLASYLCYALFETQAYVGLRKGLEMYAGLLNTFWEGLHPEKKRPRRRIAAVEWLVERLEHGLAKRQPTVADKELVEGALATLDEISRFLDQELGGEAPHLGKAAAALREVASKLNQQTPPPSPAPEAASPSPAPTPTPKPAAASESQDFGKVVASDQNVAKNLRQVHAAIRNVAAYLRESKPKEARGYRLTRMASWLMVDALPPDNGGITQLNGITRDLAVKYETYFKEQSYAELLAEVEESITRAPFWLDGHRYTAIALEGLGPAYAKAKVMVVSEVAHFLERFPGIEDLKFKDGTPFADDATRLWMDTEVAGVGGAAATPMVSISTLSGGADNAEYDAREGVVKEAKQLTSKGKMAEGLALFDAGKASSRSQRERFLWGLSQARFCHEAGLIEVAIALLEHLDQQCTEYLLEVWEPALSADVAKLLLICYACTADKNKQSDDGLQAKMRDAFSRLCQLDLTAALSMNIAALRK